MSDKIVKNDSERKINVTSELDTPKDFLKFIMDKNITIDINSDWFKELWYPLSKKRHVLGSMPLFDWLGYEGKTYLKQRNFKKLLDNNKIPYEEILYDDHRFLDHPVMQREIKQTNAGNLILKRWLVLEIRDFKKAVMRLNTKNAEIIRDYYLNLEETCFEYAEYRANWLREKAELKSKSREEELIRSMSLLAIKDTELEESKQREEQERQRANEAHMKLRSEVKRHKEQIKRTLEFNQATKVIEPLEYIYICTTEYYQRNHKFKVGGVQTFELLKSRLTQYNSGESNSEAHFFIYVRKTVSYRSIEHIIKGLLSGFRENQSNELYIMHCDWLVKFLDAIMDGNSEFALLVNNNREQIALDTINKEPTILPPIQLEQIAYIRAGDAPRDLSLILGQEMIDSIKEAIESFEPTDNTVKRKEFETYLLSKNPNVSLTGKRRNTWELTRQLGLSINPMWRYKY